MNNNDVIFRYYKLSKLIYYNSQYFGSVHCPVITNDWSPLIIVDILNFDLGTPPHGIYAKYKIQIILCISNFLLTLVCIWIHFLHNKWRQFNINLHVQNILLQKRMTFKYFEIKKRKWLAWTNPLFTSLRY